MADSNPPGGWPWGKNKPGGDSAQAASEVASGAQSQIHESGEQQSEHGGSQQQPQQSSPIRLKDDTASQATQSRASAMRGPESVSGNKSVKYEDEQQQQQQQPPVSVQGPGSNRSFSRTGKDPSVQSEANEGAEGAESVTEKATSNKGAGGDDEPEDEGKDLSEPSEHAAAAAANQSERSQSQAGGDQSEAGDPRSERSASQTGDRSERSQSRSQSQTGDRSERSQSRGQSQTGDRSERSQSQTGDRTEASQSGVPSQAGDQTDKSQTRSGIGSFFSGAKNAVSSLGGSGTKTNASGTELPDSVRELQQLQSQGGGENLTLPGGEDDETKTSTEEVTPDETPEADQQSETATWGHTTTAKQTRGGFTEGGFTEDQEDEEEEVKTPQAEGQTEAPTEGQTGYTEGQTEFTEGQTEAQGTQSEVPTSQIPESERDQLPEGVSEGQELPEGAEGEQQLPEGAEGEQQLPEGAEGQQQLPEGAEGEQQLPEGVEGQQGPVGDDQQTVLTSATGYETNTTAEAAEVDYSILKGAKVNKLGYVVNDKGQAIGRITAGIMSQLIGRKCDENGIIWNDSGKEIGRAEPIPDNELQDLLAPKPFESFEGNTIDAKGWVTWQGQTVGKVIEGDIKQLQGKTVDPDGEILDKAGNVIGKAERYEEPEEEVPEEEAPIDLSALAGKRVNKAGNVVDSNGVIYGRVVDGNLQNMIGRMCNKNGEIVSESGDVLGHAELVSEGEREGSKEGPFAELSGLTVAKDGTVVTPSGDIVGRLVKGDPKILAGRPVDEDGDILDRNGNVLGHAERWEPEPEPEVEKEKGPLAGLKVNNDGNVVDKNGNIVAKLTSGDPHICAGKEIDDDGDVINSKGMTVGHVNLLSEIQEEEPEEEEVESEEAKAERLQKEQDKKLAIQMSIALEQCLDKIKPICKMITNRIQVEEAKPEDERDEEALVKEVRPLIEEGSNILREAHGVIRGLDPDGHIQANAKHKTGTREASPEEFHLADVIKELTEHVTETIEDAKRKLEGMPHAKKELNPLWGLLGEPLFQIIAAVGLLLTGVLGIVGRLLQGLGLGGILDGLLGTLGLNKLLDSLGLGSILGGGKKKK